MAAAFAVALLLRWGPAPDPRSFFAGDWEYYAQGAELRRSSTLRSFPGWFPTAFRMPLYPAALALLPRGLTAAARFNAVADALVVPIVFFLAVALSGWTAGLAGAWLYALWPWRPSPGLGIEPFYALTVAAAALAALWYWQKPDSRERAALAGAAVGLSLFCRSTLLLLPLLLLRRGRRGVFLAACALVLLPWTLRNAAMFGRFIPFENGAAAFNAASAAGGVDEAGPVLGLQRLPAATARAQLLPEAERSSAMFAAWRKEALSRPLAILRRLLILWSEQWPLLLIALLAPRSAPLLLVLACFNLYALMAVTPRYATPAAGLLCALAAAAVLRGKPAGDLRRPALALVGLLAVPWLYACVAFARERALYPAGLPAVPLEHAAEPERYLRLKAAADAAITLAVGGDQRAADAALTRVLAEDPAFGEALISRSLLRGGSDDGASLRIIDGTQEE